MSHNSTAIGYINKQRVAQSTTCNQLWTLSMEKGIHVSSAHILGKQNILADTVSTKSHDVSEWMLSKNIFSHLAACFGMHEVDFFCV